MSLLILILVQFIFLGALTNNNLAIYVRSLCRLHDSWYYQSESELDGSSHWGLVASYGGGGFVQNMGGKKAISKEYVSQLKENLWLERGTRVVFIDFTVYNANINLFCVIRLVAGFWTFRCNFFYVFSSVL